MIAIYTDGACIPNPGRGGWGFAVFSSEGHCVYQDCGGKNDTTNNVMELTAVIKALVYAGKHPALIYSDSQYCVKGLNEWRHKWKRNNWRKGKGTMSAPVANADLWRELDALADASQATFKWIRGHNGNHGNELADRLAEIGWKGEFVSGVIAA